MSDDIRLTQLRRMLAEPFADLDAARAAISDDPGRLARALVAEAAASDDVASVAAAREYIASRLEALEGVIAGGNAGGGAERGGGGAGGVGVARPILPNRRTDA